MHHGCQNFGFYSLWNPDKANLQDILLSQIIPGNFNFPMSLQDNSWRNNWNFNNNLFNSKALFMVKNYKLFINFETYFQQFFCLWHNSKRFVDTDLLLMMKCWPLAIHSGITNLWMNQQDEPARASQSQP